MTTVTEKEKGLASLALFSQLYDEKKDIISVIVDFIKLSVIHHRNQFVSMVSIEGYLREDYGFEIPKAVVECAIRKADFLNRDNAVKTNYIVDNSKLKEEGISYEEKIHEVEDGVNNVVFSLRKALIDKHFNGADKISDIEFKRALSAFLIEEDHTSDLSQQIEQFVISNPELKPILQKVVQGSIIFMGLSYNSKPVEYTVIESDLVIYLDTELLFYMAGYNGEIFRGLFEEFYDVVSEINRFNYAKNGRELIHLRYFPEIKDEIDGYFSTAESIVSGRMALDSSKNAMAYIVSSAKTPSAIVAMKNSFWWKVNNKFLIKEEEYKGYYETKNKMFNIESREFLESVLGDEDDKGENLKYLNYVNILRGSGSQSEFKKMGFVFLTQTSVALKLSQLLRKDDMKCNVPLAFTLGEMTTRLWLGLNRGFNPTATLKNFDVIIKAQIALAARTTQSVENKHKELMKKKDEYSNEEMASCIAALRLAVPMRPEEMTMDNEDVLQANDLGALIEDKMYEIQHKDTLIKEKDTEIKTLKTYKELADSRQKENTELKEYIRKGNLEKICVWRRKRNKYVRRRLLFKTAMNILCVVLALWVLVCVICAVRAFLNDSRGQGWLAICVALTSILLDGVMYYSLIPGKKAVISLFGKKEKSKYKRQLIVKYLKKHNRPVYRDPRIKH